MTCYLWLGIIGWLVGSICFAVLVIYYMVLLGSYDDDDRSGSDDNI